MRLWRLRYAMIMPSAGWRIRKTGGIIQSNSQVPEVTQRWCNCHSEDKDLRIGEGKGMLLLLSPRVARPKIQELCCLRSEEDACANSRKKEFTLFPSFCSMWVLKGLQNSCPILLVYQFKANLFWEQSVNMPRSTALWACWLTHITITNPPLLNLQPIYITLYHT